MTDGTNPNDWSMFVYVCGWARISLNVHRFCEERSQPVGMERRTESGPHFGEVGIVYTICADLCSIPTSCRMCLLGTFCFSRRSQCVANES